MSVYSLHVGLRSIDTYSAGNSHATYSVRYVGVCTHCA